MFQSMTFSVEPEPEEDVDVDVLDEDEPPALTVSELRFMPPVSKSTVICWVPAVSVAVKLTVCHDCQPPVAGIFTLCHTPLPLKPTCADAPDGDATFNCTV